MQVADQLYDALVTSGYSFREHIYPLFLARDITRHDMRELVRRGCRHARELPRDAQAVRHVATRLQAIPEFPDGARLPRGLPGISERRAGRETAA
jgi:hypothetical protein